MYLDVEGTAIYWSGMADAHSRKGHPRIFLENADAVKGIKKPGVKMFGVQWR